MILGNPALGSLTLHHCRHRGAANEHRQPPTTFFLRCDGKRLYHPKFRIIGRRTRCASSRHTTLRERQHWLTVGLHDCAKTVNLISGKYPGLWRIKRTSFRRTPQTEMPAAAISAGSVHRFPELKNELIGLAANGGIENFGAMIIGGVMQHIGFGLQGKSRCQQFLFHRFRVYAVQGIGVA